MAVRKVLTTMLPQATADKPGIGTVAPNATPAMLNTSGEPGLVALAADSDRVSKDKAATPANVKAQVEESKVLATSATVATDGEAGLVVYAKDADTTSRNKATTPAGTMSIVNTAVQSLSGIVTQLATPSTIVTDGNPGLVVYARDYDDAARDKAVTPAGLTARLMEQPQIILAPKEHITSGVANTPGKLEVIGPVEFAVAHASLHEMKRHVFVTSGLSLTIAKDFIMMATLINAGFSGGQDSNGERRGGAAGIVCNLPPIFLPAGTELIATIGAGIGGTSYQRAGGISSLTIKMLQGDTMLAYDVSSNMYPDSALYNTSTGGLSPSMGQGGKVGGLPKIPVKTCTLGTPGNPGISAHDGAYGGSGGAAGYIPEGIDDIPTAGAGWRTASNTYADPGTGGTGFGAGGGMGPYRYSNGEGAGGAGAPGCIIVWYNSLV